jgi:hypothetical protein
MRVMGLRMVWMDADLGGWEGYDGDWADIFDVFSDELDELEVRNEICDEEMICWVGMLV